MQILLLLSLGWFSWLGWYWIDDFKHISLKENLAIFSKLFLFVLIRVSLIMLFIIATNNIIDKDIVALLVIVLSYYSIKAFVKYYIKIYKSKNNKE